MDFVSYLSLHIRESRHIDEHRAMLRFMSACQSYCACYDKRTNGGDQTRWEIVHLRMNRMLQRQYNFIVFNMTYNSIRIVQKHPIRPEIVCRWIETYDKTSW